MNTSTEIRLIFESLAYVALWVLLIVIFTVNLF